MDHETLAREIAARHGVRIDSLQRSPYGENVILHINDDLVLKLFRAERNQHARELAALETVSAWRFAPRVVAAGDQYILMTAIPGTRLTALWPSLDRDAREPLIRSIAVAMRELHELRTDAAALNRDWRAYVEVHAAAAIEHQRSCGVPEGWLDELPSYLARIDTVLALGDDRGFLHGDIHPGNLIVQERNGRWELSGIIDFGDSFSGPAEYELVAPGVLMVQGDKRLQLAMLEESGLAPTEELRLQLMLLMILYECADLRKYALRLGPGALSLSLHELERAIWCFA